MKRYVIFDVDGTINQTELYAVKAYQKALEKRHRNVTREEVISLIGMSPESIIQKLFGTLTEEETKEWRKEIEEYEAVLMHENAAAFPGMKETLETLKEEGYSLAICSNNYPDHIKGVLNAIGLTDCFDHIASLEMGKDKKECLKSFLHSVASTQACMVGDRRFDREAARENKIPFIGCAYGYAPEEIKDADEIVETPKDIIPAVNRIFAE